jgi:uncharacterized protein (TIGR02145 family)/uncharacterized repeat protein (TIGR02543 family)
MKLKWSMKMTVIKKRTYKFVGLLFCLAITAIFSTCEKVPDYCSRGNRYDSDRQFCFSGKAYPLCSNGDYNPLTEGCDKNNFVGTRCADDSTFVPPGTPCAGFTIHTASAPSDGGTIGRTIAGPNYDAGSQVTLTAEHAEGYMFIGWTGVSESTNAAVTLTMNRNLPHNMSLVAMFNPVDLPGATTHTLVTTAFPENGGSVSPAGNTTHNTGTQVTVTATPNEGYTFTGWSGASTSVSSSVTITMDASKTLVAMFTPIVYTFTVNANPRAGGTVFIDGTALAGAAPQDAGTQVVAFAQAADGYIFTGWEGAATVTTNPVTVNITSSNQTLIANFQQQEGPPPSRRFALTVNANPAHGGTVTGGGTFDEGADVPITATENSGCTFIGWAGAGVADPSAANTTVSMTTTRAVTANFSCGGGGESFTDERDGKTYRTVVIGSQTWMAENLNWAGGGGDLGWCYGNNASNCDLYGRLYDWNTVMAGSPSSSSIPSGVQGICPFGWHVPSDAEWMTLVNFVGSGTAGTQLKAASPYWNGTDTHGFSALPGGFRFTDGNFWDVGMDGRWWSVTEGDATGAWFRGVYSGYSLVDRYWGSKADGFSLRCLR